MAANISGTSIGTGLNTFGMTNAEAQSNRATLESEMKKTESFQQILEAAQASEDKEQLMSACMDFEQYFLQLMYKEMRKTVDSTSSGLIPKSQAEQYFQEMLDEEYSKQATNVGGIGLSKFLYQQLSGQYQLPIESQLQANAAAKAQSQSISE